MGQEDSDQYLRKLRNEEENGPPPPNSKAGAKAAKPKRKPNQGSTAGRISARRIGGPNLQQDFESYKNAKLAQNQNANSSKGSSTSASRMMPMPLNLGNNNPAPAKRSSQRSLGGTLPRPQELGALANTSGTVSSRRNSSRMKLPLVSRSRSSSNSSNQTEPNAQKEREAIIRYGELLKKAVVTPEWKSRFFVLTDKHLFYYIEPFDVPQEFHQIDIAPKGKIELGMIEEVRKDKNDSSGATFQILTETRTYLLRLEIDENLKNDVEKQLMMTRYGAEAWVAAIKGACENVRQQLPNLTNGTKNARGSFGLKVDEVDEAVHNAQGFKHPAKRLIDAAQLPKGPHSPAAIDEVEAWTPFDVAAWLYTVTLHKYSEDFYQHGVDGKKLKEVSNDTDARALGVEDEDVERFLEAVETLKAISVLSETNI